MRSIAKKPVEMAGYYRLVSPFIDGIGINLGNVPVASLKAVMRNLILHINKCVPEIAIKTINFSRQGAKTLAWLTLEQMVANLTDKTIHAVKRVCSAVNDFCIRSMNPADIAELDLKVVKLDTTIDMAGSFMPSTDGSAKSLIKFKLEALIKEMVMSGKFKFFCDRTINEPQLAEANGNLSTCIKFDVLGK